MVELNIARWAAVFVPGAVLGGTVGLLMHKPIGWCAMFGSERDGSARFSSTPANGEAARSASCSPRITPMMSAISS